MSDEKLDINDLKNIVKGFEGLEKYIEILYKDIRTLAKVQNILISYLCMPPSRRDKELTWQDYYLKEEEEKEIMLVYNKLLKDIFERTEFLEKGK